MKWKFTVDWKYKVAEKLINLKYKYLKLGTWVNVLGFIPMATLGRCSWTLHDFLISEKAPGP